ncbi:MAG: hypothetical protein A3F09_04150 [Chlamydiae bacterium RIFCSPHIGHO2_12_FULL_49_11]|nr:MAG: hypothetical protein A3F09_04150 [Chlamydiae bacterium RIFCSPHIGHO2_12_FULL_49_11]
MSGTFQDLLDILSEKLGTPLTAGLHNSIAIDINHEVTVQLELDNVKEYLLMGATVALLQPEPVRDRIFMKALLANGNIYNTTGTFSFVPKKGYFYMHKAYFFQTIDPEPFFHDLLLFADRVLAWKKAIRSGHPGPEDPNEFPSETVTETAEKI